MGLGGGGLAGAAHIGWEEHEQPRRRDNPGFSTEKPVENEATRKPSGGRGAVRR